MNQNSSALHPATVEWLGKTVRELQPQLVLEFGMGTGLGTRTILDNCMAFIVSVEHQQRWIDNSSSWNKYDGRLEIVKYEYIYCPNNCVDMIIVDGKDRYKCLVENWDKLKSGGIIILDDARRATEKVIMKRWEKELNLSFSYEDIGRGIGVAYKDDYRFQ
jgi:predicted O-methyltransferase YrrM